MKNVLRLNDEATSVKVDPDPDTHEEYYAADVEVVQSEIEAETYEIDEVTGENGEVTTYYINTDVANAKMDLDHDYYIEASDMKIVTISDTKPLRITTTNANIIEAETVTDVVDNEQVTIIADGSAIDDVPDHIHHEQLIDQNGCDARGPVDQNRDLCIICGSMQSKGNLRRHMETHLGEKRRQPFACQHCDRKFINRPSFEAHVNKHIGVKPFQCKVCDKTFYGSNLLRTHMYSHSTENKYACSDCDKVFRYPHYLSQHRRIHRANTVYRCEHCEYTNVYLHNYKNHLRKHTGEYKFSCKVIFYFFYFSLCNHNCMYMYILYSFARKDSAENSCT